MSLWCVVSYTLFLLIIHPQMPLGINVFCIHWSSRWAIVRSSRRILLPSVSIPNVFYIEPYGEPYKRVWNIPVWTVLKNTGITVYRARYTALVFNISIHTPPRLISDRSLRERSLITGRRVIGGSRGAGGLKPPHDPKVAQTEPPPLQIPGSAPGGPLKIMEGTKGGPLKILWGLRGGHRKCSNLWYNSLFFFFICHSHKCDWHYSIP